LLLDCLYLVTVRVTHFGVILPAVISLALILFSLFQSRWHAWLSNRRWRLLAWRGVLVGFFLWLASLTAFFIAMQRLQLSDVANTDAQVIIVLGSGSPNNQASPTLAERLQLAARLAQLRPSAMVVVSGGAGFNEEVTEARVMADYLVGLGLDAKRIILEDRSTSTHENLVFAARLLEDFGMTRSVSMLLVTSDFHTARASWIAKRAGWINVRTAGALTPLYMRYNAWLREYFACLSGWLLGEF
jgi:uncharacterized SAM-binding protein YcdF (DUF218 family)